MSVTKANLQAGTGVLYTAATGEALPEIDDLEPPSITVTPGGNWEAIGGTIEDHEFEIEVEFEDVFVNEHLGPVKTVCVKEGGIFRIQIAESDLAHLNYALSSRTTYSQTAAGANQTAQDLLKFGDKASTSEVALLYLGSTPEGGSRVIHIPYAVATGGPTVTFAKGHKGFGAEWTILCDPDGTAGARMFTIYDITAAATG